MGCCDALVCNENEWRRTGLTHDVTCNIPSSKLHFSLSEGRPIYSVSIFLLPHQKPFNIYWNLYVLAQDLSEISEKSLSECIVKPFGLDYKVLYIWNWKFSRFFPKARVARVGKLWLNPGRHSVLTKTDPLAWS